METVRNLSDPCKEIFTRIRLDGPVTKTALLRVPGMTLTTLNRLMAPLESSGLVAECGRADSSGGRKPVLYDADRHRFRLIGIDISRTYTQVVVTNLKMEVLRKRDFPMNASSTPERTVDRIAEIIRAELAAEGVDAGGVLGVGIAAVGPLDAKRGVILRPRNFAAKGWTDVPIAELVSSAVGIEAVMDNGANCAAVAEHQFGAGRGLENIAYFNCGIGIRCGSISCGHLVPTADGAEDAFAHMTVNFDGERCSCGNAGCVECYASIDALTRNYAARTAAAASAAGKPPARNTGYPAICAAAEAGETAAAESIKNAAEVFGTALANYINLLNPELVILSGPLIFNSPLFYRTAVDTAHRKRYAARSGNMTFHRGGRFAETAMAVGAAATAAEAVLR